MPGKPDVEVCEIMWTDTDDATQLAARRASTDAGDRLRLVYRTRVVTLEAGKDAVVLGRDTTADLVGADRMASRPHCEIGERPGGVLLADPHPKGTFPSIHGAP